MDFIQISAVQTMSVDEIINKVESLHLATRNALADANVYAQQGSSSNHDRCMRKHHEMSFLLEHFESLLTEWFNTELMPTYAYDQVSEVKRKAESNLFDANGPRPEFFYRRLYDGLRAL